MDFDFAGLADRVRRNNLGVDAIHVEGDVRFVDGRVVFARSDQSFPVQGEVPADGWTRLSVLHWDDPERTQLIAAR